MATAKTTPAIEITATERAGVVIGATIDVEPGIVRGYRAAREPELVEKRKEANIARRSAITAKLLADLSA